MTSLATRPSRRSRPAPTDYVPAAELRQGDRIRDRGQLRTILKVKLPEREHECVTVVMTGRCELGIAPGQHVYVWRDR